MTKTLWTAITVITLMDVQVVVRFTHARLPWVLGARVGCSALATLSAIICIMYILAKYVIIDILPEHMFFFV